MSIHTEKIYPVWNTVLIMVFAFALIYPLWELGVRDLFWEEGEYAAIASEISSFPPETRAHGELMPYYFPLFPLIAKGLTAAGMSMEFSLRLISVFSLAGLTAMCGLIVYQMAGVQAGAATAAAIFGTFLTAEKVIEGYPQMLTVLLICTGWMLWFYLGQFRSAWSTGWLCNGIFAGLAFYCGGWTALVYYFLPMIFLKRPFTPWRRLSMPGFPLCLIIILLFIICWMIPRWAPDQNSTWLFPGRDSFAAYLLQILVTPWEVFIHLLPWIFFIYAPFCPALRVIDKNPLFSRYLRVLFLISAVILLLNPYSRSRDILYLLPSMAMLIGLNYEIVVRRHGDLFCRILRWISAGAFLLCVLAVFIEILPTEYFRYFPFLQKRTQLITASVSLPRHLLEAGIGIFCAVIAYLLTFRTKTVWLITLLSFTSIMLFSWSLLNPYKEKQRSRSEMGLAFRQAIGKSWNKKMTVYKDNAISGLYPECYYLGTRIKTIQSSRISECKEPELFLLTVSSIQPSDTSRVWTQVLNESYKNQKLYIWKGTLNERNNGPENNVDDLFF